MGGYLYQVRYALLMLLEAIERGSTDAAMSIETSDDVEFYQAGTPVELLQTKHSFKTQPSLSDTSTEIWKTLRIWSEYVASGSPMLDFTLVSTAKAAKSTVAHLLQVGHGRDVSAALERLDAIAMAAANKENEPYYASYISLDDDTRRKMVERIKVVDAAPDVSDIEAAISAKLRISSRADFLVPFVELVEGWWFKQVVNSLKPPRQVTAISAANLHNRIQDAREEFLPDNLPINYDEELDLVAANVPEDKQTFIRQLEWISVREKRIRFAISDYHRAFHQRNKWVADRLLVSADLEAYESRLFREWEESYEQMLEKGVPAVEAEKAKLGRELYDKMINLDLHIRDRVTRNFVMRGSFHILTNEKPCGWHPEFKQRLKDLAAKAVGATK